MSRHPLLRAAGWLALLTALTAVAAPSAAADSRRPAAVEGPRLPAPTGKHPVGTRTLHLKDVSRPDPWKPGTDARELMATLWYPASAPSGRPAPYMSPRLSTAVIGTEEFGTVRTNSTAGARPRPGRRPLVVLSPGFGLSRLLTTTLAEDLASRGYVVAAVDHTHEAAVEFPDGRLEPCLICEDPDHDAVIRNRAADIGFLLDELTRPQAGIPVDRSRIAVAGHSAGGASAVETLGTDPRVDAAVNMDGDFLTEPPARPVGLPVMLLGAQRRADPRSAANWEERMAHFTGWKRLLDLPDAGHLSFSDAAWLGGEFDLSDRLPPGSLGTLSGARATDITRAHVAAFLDLHLRGRGSPLLDGPSPAYPEVEFLR